MKYVAWVTISEEHGTKADTPLTGRVALVTGGSRGLGRAVCVELARAGADVAFTYRRDQSAADETLGLISAHGVRGMAELAPVDSIAHNLSALRSVGDKLGDVAILVNNAGIVSSGREVLDTPLDEVERLMRIHALGPMQLCQLVLPGMRARGRGDIVMISSMATRTFLPRAAAYAMAKSASEALAYSLAVEEQPNRVRVNIVAPGLVDTDMGRRLLTARPQSATEFASTSTPEQVARLVLYVVSDENTQTGHRFGMDGGMRTA